MSWQFIDECGSFCKPVIIIARAHVSTELKQFITKPNKGGIQFTSKHALQVHKIQFCFTICLVMCESQLCYVDTCSSCVLLCHDDTDIPSACKSYYKNFLKMSPVQHQFHPVFPQLAHFLPVLSQCHQLILEKHFA